jgi:hypothetical protein
MPRGRRRNGQDALIRSAEFIGWAIGGIEREIAETRERLAALNAQAAKLRARAGSRKPAGSAATLMAGSPAAPAAKRRRRISAEGRKRISEAQKKRWAESRKKKGA